MKNSLKVSIAVIMLSTTMCTGVAEKSKKANAIAEHSFEGSYDWKNHMVDAERKRDAAGKLLSLQSYKKTILRGMSFLLEDHLKWFRGWEYSGNKQALTEAVKLGDWNIAHSTPDNWAYGNMPYSTFEEKKPGGFRDKSGIMPDKGAIMALAFIELYKASGKPRFLQAAEAIAQTLVRNQRANGTWPFRVDPETEEVVEEYTSSVIFAIKLFEALDEINQNTQYRANRDQTWEW